MYTYIYKNKNSIRTTAAATAAAAAERVCVCVCHAQEKEMKEHMLKRKEVGRLLNSAYFWIEIIWLNTKKLRSHFVVVVATAAAVIVGGLMCICSENNKCAVALFFPRFSLSFTLYFSVARSLARSFDYARSRVCVCNEHTHRFTH